jgi:transposase-like protein
VVQPRRVVSLVVVYGISGRECIRAIAERMVQELIEAEASAHIGAEWNEHTPTRTNVATGTATRC